MKNILIRLAVVIGIISVIGYSYADTGTCVSKESAWDQFFHGETTTFIQTDPKEDEQDGLMLVRKEGPGSCMAGCMDTYCAKDLQPDDTVACAKGERLSAMASDNDTQCVYIFYRDTAEKECKSSNTFLVSLGSVLGGAVVSGVLTYLITNKLKKGYNLMK